MATAKKPVIPQPTPGRTELPKKPKKAAAAPIDLSALLRLPAQLESGINRILDKMSQPAPVVQPLQTGVEHAAERLEAILTIFTGKQAQNVLQDMLEAGRPPSREQLLREADKLIAARGGK